MIRPSVTFFSGDAAPNVCRFQTQRNRVALVSQGVTCMRYETQNHSDTPPPLATEEMARYVGRLQVGFTDQT